MVSSQENNLWLRKAQICQNWRETWHLFLLACFTGITRQNGGRGSVCSLLLVLWCIVKVAQLCPALSDPKEFSRQEYWSGSPFPSPGNLPNPVIKLRSLTLQVDSLPAEPLGKSKNTGVGSLSKSPGDLPNPGIEPGSPSLQANSLTAELLVHIRPLINEWISPHIWRPWYIILPDLTFQWTPLLVCPVYNSSRTKFSAKINYILLLCESKWICPREHALISLSLLFLLLIMKPQYS